MSKKGKNLLMAHHEQMMMAHFSDMDFFRNYAEITARDFLEDKNVSRYLDNMQYLLKAQELHKHKWAESNIDMSKMFKDLGSIMDETLLREDD